MNENKQILETAELLERTAAEMLEKARRMRMDVEPRHGFITFRNTGIRGIIIRNDSTIVTGTPLEGYDIVTEYGELLTFDSAAPFEIVDNH